MVPREFLRGHDFEKGNNYFKETYEMVFLMKPITTKEYFFDYIKFLLPSFGL